jgi:hypothetical protein
MVAFGSGFLIASNLVVTAGHCIMNEGALTNIVFVVGYQMQDELTAVTNLPIDHVFHGIELIGREDQGVFSGARDWALVRLDRPVELYGILIESMVV